VPPPAQGRTNLPSADDHTLWSLLVSLGGTVFLFWYVWDSYHTEISAGFVTAAHWHIRALGRSTRDLDALDAAMLAANPARMTFGKLQEVGTVIGGHLRAPAALLLGGLGVLCFLRAAPTRFTRRLDLDGLMREQATTYRSTAAFLERRLGIVAPRAGEPRPADPALHPNEWIKRHAVRKGVYDDAAACGEMARQLGPLWQGVAVAAPHVRVLYAAFALHLVQRRQDALALLGDMAEALATPEPGEGPAGPERPWPLPSFVAARADEVLCDPEVASTAKAVAAFHGYTATVMMSLLNEARRRSGVLAPAQFNGLKLVDRRLWYALHSLGFPAEGLGRDQHPNPLVEAIGARDHWASECAARGPLVVPSIERAAEAVRAAAGDAPAATRI
jgi:intracellular multiplication protein IcmP